MPILATGVRRKDGKRYQCLEALYHPRGGWSCSQFGDRCWRSAPTPQQAQTDPERQVCAPVPAGGLWTWGEVEAGAPQRLRATEAGDPIWTSPSDPITDDVAEPLSDVWTYALWGAGALVVYLLLGG